MTFLLSRWDPVVAPDGLCLRMAAAGPAGRSLGLSQLFVGSVAPDGTLKGCGWSVLITVPLDFDDLCDVMVTFIIDW